MLSGACRRLGGFEPDVRHRANDVAIMRALIAVGQAVGLLPGLARMTDHPGVATRPIAEAPLGRTIYAFHRRSTAARPAVRALVDALRAASAELPER